MATYRVGSMRGRTVSGATPHALVCEACNEEMDEHIPVERGQEKFSGMTLAGVRRIWPAVETIVRQHEDRYHKTS